MTALAFAPVHQDPVRSFTLPSALYTDPATFAREKEAIFYRSWIPLGHVSEVATPGQYMTGWVADQHVFAIRGRDGELHAFYNVCQHRAHELVQGAGRCSAIVCPYHAWTYELDGRLRSARRCETMPGFERARFSLVPVRHEVLHGLVFVNLDEHAAPLAQQAPGLAEDLARLAPDLPGFVRYGNLRWPQAINWKTRIDNSLECYHCENAHPGFKRMVDLGVYEIEQQGIFSRQTGALRAEGGNGAGYYAFWHVWPLAELRYVSAVRAFNMYRHRPQAAEALDMEVVVYGPEGRDEATRQELVKTWGDTDFVREDIALCASVQRGLNSRGYRQGRFFVDDSYQSEVLVHQFHRMVAQALGL